MNNSKFGGNIGRDMKCLGQLYSLNALHVMMIKTAISLSGAIRTNFYRSARAMTRSRGTGIEPTF